MIKNSTETQHRFSWLLTGLMVPVILLGLVPSAALGQGQFHLQEATINDLHNAIKDGQITCQGLVQAYINRAKAYNGACTALVTKDGASIPPAKGAVRTGSPV